MPLKLINKYALPRDQNIFDFTIAIERPLSEFVRNFFDSGKPRVGHPRVAVDADCQALPFPTFFRPGDKLPIIYPRVGVIQFGAAKWGVEDESSGAKVFLKMAEPRTWAYPALIPATFIDIPLNREGTGDKPEILRLHSRVGGNLYIGGVFTVDPFGRAQTVTPFVCDAGDDVAKFIDWQPLLIEIAGPPTNEHFDYLLRRDARKLHIPSAHGRVKAEIVPLRSQPEMTCREDNDPNHRVPRTEFL